MPRYGDDQCEECGAVRVARSKLCAYCLQKERDILEKEVSIKMAIIWGQKARITNLEALLKEATAYGFESNQENAKLQYRIRELEKLTTGRQRCAQSVRGRNMGN
jgi:hypothetical protein